MSEKKRRQVTDGAGDSTSPDNRLDKKLLEPGWGGELSDREVEYIQQEIKRSRRLWRKWGYLGAMLRGVTIPASTIRRIAKHGLR